MAKSLNAGQRNAADAFFDFLMTDERSFAISGTAGVGKTFMMGYLAQQGLAQYRASCALIGSKPKLHNVVFTATTNKAAEVLQNTLGADVQTIHSFLCLKVKENYQTGKTELIKRRDWHPHRNLVIFIDECSMIDSALHQEILEATPDCRIVYVGDHAQMAPINERSSEIYDNLQPHNFVTLTEPVRNAGQPALVALCQQLRDTVETGIFKPIEQVDNVIHYLDDEDMNAGLHHVFTDLDPSSRVLCYTNARVQSYNQHIREEVRKRPMEPQIGDVMVLSQPYANGSANLSVEAEVEITSVGQVELYQEFSHEAPGFPIPYRKLKIRRIGSGGELEVRAAVNHTDVSNLLKAYGRKRNWSSYFDLKASFIDLRDKAACTVYKAQGSTYDTVFVDLGNIGTSHEPEQVARMLFVAVSRARNAVYLYGELPARYQNSKGKSLWAPKSLSPASLISSSSIAKLPLGV